MIILRVGHRQKQKRNKIRKGKKKKEWRKREIKKDREMNRCNKTSVSGKRIHPKSNIKALKLYKHYIFTYLFTPDRQGLGYQLKFVFVFLRRQNRLRNKCTLL